MNAVLDPHEGVSAHGTTPGCLKKALAARLDLTVLRQDMRTFRLPE